MDDMIDRDSSQRRHEQTLGDLYAISQILSSRAGQRQMLLEVLDVLDKNFGLRRATVMLLSPDGNELVVEAAYDVREPHRHPVRYQKGEGVTGRVLQTGRPAVVPRIGGEPEFRDRVHQRLKAGYHDVGFICVPIALGNEVVGTLSADVPTEPTGALAEAEHLLCIVASMIAHDVKARRMARLEREVLEAENARLRHELAERFRPENLVGNAHAMRDVYQRVHQVAPTDTTVLIRGESGTGKELVASAIHYSSHRAERPLVKVNCAALSETLLESELFGHERGAFTGATQTRIGRVEQAEGGTLFLDEIGDFSPAIQVKLLRVLQEREFQRVGSNRTIKANVRVLAATNRDLEAALRGGTFRADLYYRINVFCIHLPALRDRKDDILLLADHFADKYARQMGRKISRISTSAINMMMAYHWPGNVRELENCIEHAVLLSTDGVIRGYNLPPTLQTPTTAEESVLGSLKARVALLERDMIIDALKHNHGNVTRAAAQLGITGRMVRYKIKKLGVDYPGYFAKGKRAGAKGPGNLPGRQPPEK